MERFLDVDKQQEGRCQLMDRNGFLRFLEMRFKEERPQAAERSRGDSKHDDDDDDNRM